ncbi:MAG: phosphate ABC transporter permease PstA [Comamonadaceae bacterium]|nr:phosphate ABC transporter permease PstA [Comamonadaceae bacterium]
MFNIARLLAAQALPRGVLMDCHDSAPTQISPADRPPQALREQLFTVIGLLALLVGAADRCSALFARPGGRRRAAPDPGVLHLASRRAAPSKAGILSAWVGSLLVMLVTACSAVPLGVAAGVYLEEYAPKNWLTAIIEINVTNLAGVPSIVYGLLALGLFVYQFGFGQSILSAGLTLALLILPIVIVATREALRADPGSIREAAYALGATRWQMVSEHIVPYSAAGILTGVIIGLSRAIGETAPIITIGALTFIAFLPAPPVTGEFAVPVVPMADGSLHGDADPDVQLDLAPRGSLPAQRRRSRRGPAGHDPGR